MSPIDLSSHRFDALIFDCDGTLAQTAPVHYAAFSAATAAFGPPMPEAWYYARLGISRRELLEEFQAEFGVTLDLEAVAEHSTRLYRGNVGAVREVAIVAAVARRYAGRVPMAVASGGQRPLVEATLAAIGLRALFDPVVTVEEVAEGKPAPALFLEAARRMGVAPAGCLVFEDSDEGLEAARRAGMAAIDVRPLVAAA